MKDSPGPVIQSPGELFALRYLRDIRGIGNTPSRSLLKDTHKPDLVAIAKGKFHFGPLSVSRYLNRTFVQMASLTSGCSAPVRLLVLKRFEFRIMLVEMVGVKFHVGLCMLKILTWIDWNDIRNLALHDLLLVGDFHAVLGAHERAGGAVPLPVSCSDFRNFLEDPEEEQIPTTGSFFTWTATRPNLFYIKARLDRL